MAKPRTAHRRAASDRRSWVPVSLVLGVVLAGIGAKLSCLGPDGLTLDEAALPWSTATWSASTRGGGSEQDCCPIATS